MKDFITTPAGDLQIADGDLVIGDSDMQHQTYLLSADKGSYKQYPTTGVGLINFLNDDSPADMLREIRIQFAQDGMAVHKLAMVNGKLEVVATYGS